MCIASRNLKIKIQQLSSGVVGTRTWHRELATSCSTCLLQAVAPLSFVLHDGIKSLSVCQPFFTSSHKLPSVTKMQPNDCTKGPDVQVTVFWEKRHWEALKGGFVIKGGFGECTLVAVFVPGEHANVPSGGTCERTLVPVFVSGEHPNGASSGFHSRGTSAKTTHFENHPFVNPRKRPLKHLALTVWVSSLGFRSLTISYYRMGVAGEHLLPVADSFLIGGTEWVLCKRNWR